MPTVAVAVLLLAAAGGPASATQTPTEEEWTSVAVGAADGLGYTPTPDVDFAQPSTPTTSAAVAAGGCHGHVDTPLFDGSARTVYVQGYIACTEPAVSDVLTRPQI